MIPHVISGSSITFVVPGNVFNVPGDHPNFDAIKDLLLSGSDDAGQLSRLADVRVAVEDATDGRARLTEEGLYLDGEQLPAAWSDKAHAAPQELRVLVVSPGDRVRVEGDEDAPDGIYTVGDVDNSDAEKRVYVESDEDYFGFVANASIKEILS